MNVSTGRQDRLGIFKSFSNGLFNSTMSGIFWEYNFTTYNWSGKCCNAGTCTVTSLFKQGDTDWHVFSIIGNQKPEPNKLGTNYTFYIDNTYYGYCDTNLNQPLAASAGTWTESYPDATADHLYIDWAYLEMNRIGNFSTGLGT